jgi:hypothetical protein
MDLRERVKRLERENRWLKLIGVGVLILMAVSLVWQLGINHAQPVYAEEPKIEKYDTIQARRFELVSKDGTRMGALVAGEGSPYLSMTNEKGKSGIVLGAGGDRGGYIILNDKDGKPAKKIEP